MVRPAVGSFSVAATRENVHSIDPLDRPRGSRPHAVTRSSGRSEHHGSVGGSGGAGGIPGAVGSDGGNHVGSHQEYESAHKGGSDCGAMLGVPSSEHCAGATRNDSSHPMRSSRRLNAMLIDQISPSHRAVDLIHRALCVDTKVCTAQLLSTDLES